MARPRLSATLDLFMNGENLAVVCGRQRHSGVTDFLLDICGTTGL